MALRRDRLRQGACRRRRMMACTTSIGPGATNMVTAAAVAHVDRLPVLFLPGDVFATRRPDPVLQQVEDFGDGDRFGQRLLPPGVALLRPHRAARNSCSTALPRAMAGADRSGRLRAGDAGAVPGRAGRGVRLAGKLLRPARLAPAPPAAGRRRTGRGGGGCCARRSAPLIVAGGGVLYAEATDDAGAVRAARTAFRWRRPRPARARWPHDHALNLGAIGVTGTAAANRAAAAADVVLAVGTRLQDFTTGSRALFAPAPDHRAERAAVRRRQARRAAAGGGRARGARGARRRAGRASCAGRMDRRGRARWRAGWQAQAAAATAPPATPRCRPTRR